MDWIAPELREDRGEIKAAIGRQLPDLVSPDDVRGDLQMHSTYSDGENTISELAAAAQRLGHKYIAITDHSVGLGVAHGLSKQRVKKQVCEIDKYNNSHRELKILKSIEVNINADGSLDFDTEIVKMLDFVTASVHSSFNQSRDIMTKRIIKAIESGTIDNLGHPTGRLLERREGIDADWQKIFPYCVKYNVALEINANPNRLDLPDKLIIEAKKVGVKFTISTDAHSSEDLEHIAFGVSQARRGWLTKSDVLNSLPVEKLLAWVRRQ